MCFLFFGNSKQYKTCESTEACRADNPNKKPNKIWEKMWGTPYEWIMGEGKAVCGLGENITALQYNIWIIKYVFFLLKNVSFSHPEKCWSTNQMVWTASSQPERQYPGPEHIPWFHTRREHNLGVGPTGVLAFVSASNRTKSYSDRENVFLLLQLQLYTTFSSFTYEGGHQSVAKASAHDPSQRSRLEGSTKT